MRCALYRSLACLSLVNVRSLVVGHVQEGAEHPVVLANLLVALQLACGGDLGDHWESAVDSGSFRSAHRQRVSFLFLHFGWQVLLGALEA